jgi:hypothetical protein
VEQTAGSRIPTLPVEVVHTVGEREAKSSGSVTLLVALAHITERRGETTERIRGFWITRHEERGE